MNPIIIAGGVGWLLTAFLGWRLLAAQEEIGQTKQACETRIATQAVTASEAVRAAQAAAYATAKAEWESRVLEAVRRATEAEREAEAARNQVVETRVETRVIYETNPEADMWGRTTAPDELRMQLTAYGDPRTPDS